MFKKGHKLSVGNKGGRPKAGRTALVEKMREALVKRVHGGINKILDAQLDAATGLYYEEIGVGGKKRIYQREPDQQAAKLLIEQTIGKPKEQVEHSGNVTLIVDE